MTSRQGLYVALVGLVMTILCSLPLLVLRFFEDSEFARDPNLAGYAVVVFLSLGMLLGIIVLVVGLLMAGVASVVKGSGP